MRFHRLFDIFFQVVAFRKRGRLLVGFIAGATLVANDNRVGNPKKKRFVFAFFFVRGGINALPPCSPRVRAWGPSENICEISVFSLDLSHKSVINRIALLAARF